MTQEERDALMKYQIAVEKNIATISKGLEMLALRINIQDQVIKSQGLQILELKKKK